MNPLAAMSVMSIWNKPLAEITEADLATISNGLGLQLGPEHVEALLRAFSDPANAASHLSVFLSTLLQKFASPGPQSEDDVIHMSQCPNCLTVHPI